VDDNFHLYIFYSCYIFLLLLNRLQAIMVYAIHYLSVSCYCMIFCPRISCQGGITVIHS